MVGPVVEPEANVTEVMAAPSALLHPDEQPPAMVVIWPLWILRSLALPDTGDSMT